MADDWKPGDLALCINIFGNDHGYGVTSDLRIGAVYTVERVRRARDMYGRKGTALCFSDVRPSHPDAIGMNAEQFRKIHPLSIEEHNAEIRLLADKPVREPVR